jgi:quercetin dioxygenase-like cupin family protein
MPKQGQIYKNPQTGDEFEFLETAKSSGGKRVVLKHKVYLKGELVPNHFHVLQDETFEVISGNLTIWQDGKTSEIGAGQKITLEKGIKHNHYNNSDEMIEYIHTIEPALDFDYLLENIIGLTIDGKMPNGKAGLAQELVTLKYLDSKSYLADVPVGVQNLLMNTVAPIARLFGKRAIYKKYSDIEK